LSKKKGKNKRSAAPPKSQKSWLLWGAIAAAVLFVVGGLSLLLISGNTNTEPENGTPKLVVDQTVIDEGYQKLNTTIRTSFTLRNEGDATLRIQGEPQVKLVEGC